MGNYQCIDGAVTLENNIAQCSTAWTVSSTNLLCDTAPPLTPEDALYLSGAVLSVWAVSWLYRILRPTL